MGSMDLGHGTRSIGGGNWPHKTLVMACGGAVFHLAEDSLGLIKDEDTVLFWPIHPISRFTLYRPLLHEQAPHFWTNQNTLLG